MSANNQSPPMGFLIFFLIPGSVVIGFLFLSQIFHSPVPIKEKSDNVPIEQNSGNHSNLDHFTPL